MSDEIPATPAADDAAKRTVARVYQAFERCDIALLRAAVTPDWQYIAGSEDSVMLVDDMIPLFTNLSAGLPGLKIDLLDVIVHDNRVAVRARVTATHTGPIAGIAPTSKPVAFAVHSFHELRGDRVAKTWHLEDRLALYRQIGTFPPAQKT
jgi:predicted ester cyclase